MQRQSPPVRHLVVIRHAKAEQTGPSDFDRQLAPSGQADAQAAGAWLAARGLEPDLALVSAAVRTQQTWEAVADGAGWDADVATYDEGLYAAGPETAVDLVRGVEDTVSTLVLIGHNPTMASVAQTLDDGEGDEDAATDMALGFPTCALAVFSYEGDWAELDEASAALVAFHVARA